MLYTITVEICAFGGKITQNIRFPHLRGRVSGGTEEAFAFTA